MVDKTEPGETIDPLPILVPDNITTLEPISTSSSIIIGAF